MKMPFFGLLPAGIVLLGLIAQAWATEGSEILTPKPPPAPRINGPSIFGVRPNSPFIYRIPATGQRPMEFSVDELPRGLTVDPQTGQITGKLPQPGEFTITFHAKNSLGSSQKKFKILVGEKVALTPPMGWNSWNCWGGRHQAPSKDADHQNPG